MKQKYKRLKLVLFSLFIVSVGLWLILDSFNQNIIFFFTPTELKQKNITNKKIRVGGLVKEGTILKLDDSVTTEFVITDNHSDLIIIFKGILPNLFREKQGIVAKGILLGDVFLAEELLAKHDENYIPKELNNTNNYMKYSRQ